MASEVRTNKLSPATGTAFTIGDSGDTFTLPSGVTLSGAGAITVPSGGSLTIDSGATITNNGTGSGFGKFSGIAVLSNQQSASTGGGTFTSGAWRTCPLNTINDNPDSIVTSLSSNQFTLGAGSYWIDATQQAYEPNYWQLRIYNTSDSSEEFVGHVLRNLAGYGQGSNLTISGRVTIASSKTFELQARCNLNSSFGVPAGFGTERYATVNIFKEA